MFKFERVYTEFIKIVVLVLDLVLCRGLLAFFLLRELSNIDEWVFGFFHSPSRKEKWKEIERNWIIAMVKFRPYEIGAS